MKQLPVLPWKWERKFSKASTPSTCVVADLQVANTCRSKHVKLQKNFAFLRYVKFDMQNTPKRPLFCTEKAHGRNIVKYCKKAVEFRKKTA